MKVILIKKVTKLGEAGEIKEVADGFARNFLLAKKLAEPATEENIDHLKQEKEAQAKLAEKDLIMAEKLADRLNGFSLEIQGKINDAGRLYASVTATVIFKKLKESGFEIKKNQIVLAAAIKEPGEYPVKVNLDHGLEAEIMVLVSE